MSEEEQFSSPKDKHSKIRISIHSLSEELLSYTLSYVPWKDLVNSVPLVCKRWYELSKSAGVWSNVPIQLPDGAKLRDFYRAVKMAPYFGHFSLNKGMPSKLFTMVLMENIHKVRDLTIRSVTDADQIEHLLQKYGFYAESITVLGPKVTMQSLQLIGEYGCHLHTLVLYRTPFAPLFIGDSSGLQCITEGCQNLKYIDIRGVAFAQVPLARLVASKKEKLEAFLFDASCMCIGVRLPFSDCPRLKNIQCIRPPFDILQYIDSSPQITTLGFESMPMETKEIIEFFENTSFPNLTNLLLTSTGKLTADLAATIRNNLPNIRVLCLANTFKVCDPGMEELLRLENLQELECSFLDNFSQEWFEQLMLCKKLKTLKITNSRHLTTKIAFQFINKLQLRYLYLNRCDMLRDDFLICFPESETLELLVLKYCYFSREAAALVSLRERFTKIYFDNCNYS